MSRIVCCMTNTWALDRRMLRICQSLHDAGHDVELVGVKRDYVSDGPQVPFAVTSISCLFKKGKLFYLEYNLRLFLFLMRRRFDLLYLVDVDTFPGGISLARLRPELKVVYDAHEWFAELPEVERRPFIRRIWESVTRWGLKRVDVCLTVGKTLADQLQRTYGLQFQVIRNVPVLSDNQPKDVNFIPKSLVYLGALNEGRGLPQAIEALLSLPNWQLYLIGEGDYSEKLRALVKKLKLENRVHFAGYMTADEWAERLPAFTVGLNLLEARSRSYYFSLANKTFDYIHAGIPSIQMAFPEYKWHNEEIETAVLIDELSSHALVQAIQSLDSNSEQYARLKSNCMDASKAWNWQNESSLLIQIIHDLTGIAKQ